MNPRFAFLALALSALTSPVFSQTPAATQTPVPVGTTMSVLYFENTAKNAEYDWLSKGLADMVATDLASGAGVVLVEREQLEKVLRELELGLSGLIDPSGASAVGKLLDAKILVYGSFILSGSQLRVDVKAVQAESGAILSAASSTKGSQDAILAQREISQKLAAGLGIRFAAPLAEPVKLEAVKNYYRGVSLFDQGRYADALKLFNAAQGLDPSFGKPGKAIEDAYKYLKDFRRQRYRREMNVLAANIESLKARIGLREFYSFADMITAPAKFGFADAAAASAAYQQNPSVYSGDTPVQAIWNLQYMYSDLRGKAMEYFEDAVLNEYCCDQILLWAAAAEKAYPKDAFLPEVLYNQIFVYVDRQQWQNARDLCERLMGDYPDFRMMWAVEDFYERALEKLGE